MRRFKEVCAIVLACGLASAPADARQCASCDALGVRVEVDAGTVVACDCSLFAGELTIILNLNGVNVCDIFISGGTPIDLLNVINSPQPFTVTVQGETPAQNPTAGGRACLPSPDTGSSTP